MNKTFIINEPVSWKEFKKQKEMLYRFVNDCSAEFKISELHNIDGLIRLLENIEKNAIESGIWDQDEIDNPKE